MNTEINRDAIILVGSSIGIGIVMYLMPIEPTVADMLLQWINDGAAFAGECKP